MGNKSAKIQAQELNFCLQNTDFTDKEIKQWFKYFHKDCPDGFLTIDQFQSIYGQYFPNSDSADFAAHVFRCFNQRGDGRVSFREFLVSLNQTANSTSDMKIRWAFRLYDINNDQYISKDEMLEIVKAIYKLVGTSVIMPADESTPEKRTNKIFNEFDRDHDGKLSFDDFKRVAESNRSFASLVFGLVEPEGRVNSSTLTNSSSRHTF